MAITIKQYKASELPLVNWSNCSVVECSERDYVTEFVADGGLSQRVAYVGQYLKTWYVTLHYLDEAARADLLALWESRNGRAAPFRWVNNEDGQTYFVRFADSSLKLTRLNTPTKAWGATITIVQVHDAEIDDDLGG